MHFLVVTFVKDLCHYFYCKQTIINLVLEIEVLTNLTLLKLINKTLKKDAFDMYGKKQIVEKRPAMLKASFKLAKS